MFVLSEEGPAEALSPSPPAPQPLPLPPHAPARASGLLCFKAQAGLYLPRLFAKQAGLKGEVAFQALN